VHPTEFTDLLSDEIGTFRGMLANVDNIRVNPTNKKHLTFIVNYFMNKSISWLVPAFESGFNGKRVDTYLELITGGIIPKLSQKLLTVDERKNLFLPFSFDFMKQYEEPGFELDEEYLKLLIYLRFVASCDKVDFANFHLLLTKNFLPTHETLDANGLLVRWAIKSMHFTYPNSVRFSDLFQKFIHPMDPIDVNHRPDIHIRDDIRRVIFTKVRDNSISVMDDAKAITGILIEYSKRYKNFDQLEKLNIELRVPIQLPPNGKEGDCQAVVLEIQKSFNNLGGGSRVSYAPASWLDAEDNVVAEHAVVVFTSMPLVKWFECIPVLQRLIRDEIQTKLFQVCVLLRIDNQTFGDPINLLGDEIFQFPGTDEFGSIDPACLTFLTDYEEHTPQSIITQGINGDIQIHNGGINPKEYAQHLAEKHMLEEKLAELKAETDEVRRERIALEATKLTEKELLRRNRGIDGNPQIKAISLVNFGKIAETRGDLVEAERFYHESLAIHREIGNREGEAALLNYFGNIARTRGDLAGAELHYRESLAIKREIGDRKGEATSLLNLGEIQATRGYMDQAEQLFTESMELSALIGYRLGMMASLANKGNLLIGRRQDEKSVELLNEALLISRVLYEQRREAQILSHLGLAAINTGNFRLARAHFNKSLDIQREMNDTRGEGKTLSHLGNLAMQMGDLRKATSLVRESISISNKFGHHEVEGASYGSLGAIYEVQGRISQAMASYTTARDILSEFGNQSAVAAVMVSLGVNHAYLWELDEAERMFNASLSIYKTIGNKNVEQNTREYLEKLLIQKKSREQIKSEDIALGSQIGLRNDGEDETCSRLD